MECVVGMYSRSQDVPIASYCPDRCDGSVASLSQGYPEHVYYIYEDAGPALYYEMRFLSYEIQRRDLGHWIDQRFSAVLVWLIYAFNVSHDLPSHFLPRQSHLRRFIANEYAKNYFLHFAGPAQRLMSERFICG